MKKLYTVILLVTAFFGSSFIAGQQGPVGVNDTNQVTILHRSGEEKKIGPESKKAVAAEIVSFILTQLHA